MGFQEIGDAVVDDVADLFDFRQGIEELIGPTALGGDGLAFELAGFAIEAGVDFGLAAGGRLFGELPGLGVMGQEFALVKKSAGSPAE